MNTLWIVYVYVFSDASYTTVTREDHYIVDHVTVAQDSFTASWHQIGKVALVKDRFILTTHDGNRTLEVGRIDTATVHRAPIHFL